MGYYRLGIGAAARPPSVLHVRLPLPQQEPKSRSYACIPLCCVGLRSPLDLQEFQKIGSLRRTFPLGTAAGSQRGRGLWMAPLTR